MALLYKKYIIVVNFLIVNNLIHNKLFFFYDIVYLHQNLFRKLTKNLNLS